MLAAVPFTGAEPQKDLRRSKETRLVFGGDVMLSRFVGRLARARRDPSSPLKDLAPVLSAADIAFVNLEAPFSNRGRIVDEGMVFKAEPDMIEALSLAQVDVVSTANNHARDCGAYGVEFTIDWLERHGIAPVGTARTPEAAHCGVVLQRNGWRFGFLAYTYDQANGNYTDTDARIATIEIATMRRDVRDLLTRADVVIVSMHAGWEYWTRPNPQQVLFARAAIDAGARVVVGHHPHVVQPWERYKSGVIFYSLGNLVFDQYQRPETQRGELAEVVFSGAALARADSKAVDIIATVPRLASASVAERRGV